MIQSHAVYSTRRFVVAIFQYDLSVDIDIFNKELEEWKIIAQENYKGLTMRQALRKLREDFNLFNL